MTPEWRTPVVVALCQRMRDLRRFDALPILADALEENGYPDIKVLDHMRTSGVDDTQACRLVCLVFSDETANAVREVERLSAQLTDQDYTSLMTIARSWNIDEEYVYDNSESYKDVATGAWEQFWINFTCITGEAYTSKWCSSPFTCSC